MKYMNGIEVLVGDIVAVSQGHRGDIEGVVLEVVLPRTPNAQWREAPDGGVLIQGGGLGLFFTAYLEDDEDIAFVRRANGALPSEPHP